MFKHGWILLLSTFVFLGVPVAQAENDSAQTILHLLDYVAVDYPEFVKDGKILDEAEYKEQLEFANQAAILIKALPDKKERAEYQIRAQQLIESIEKKAEGVKIANLANSLRLDLIKTYEIKTAPASAPDLRHGTKLYEANCMACHGVTGKGDGAAGVSLDPKPSNFHDKDRMSQRSPFGLFNTISLGVNGTGMASYAQLGEQDRWALAFLVASLYMDKNVDVQGAALWKTGKWKKTFPDLRSLAMQTRLEVLKVHGEEAALVFDYLCKNPEVVATHVSPIEKTHLKLNESVELYRQGKHEPAYQMALTAYLEGFEVVEKKLDTVDGKLRIAVENEMVVYRNLIRADAAIGQVEQQAEKIHNLLKQSQRILEETQASSTTTAFSAFIILLREGLEAILVLASIIAFVIKTGRRDTLPYIHAGWIFALILGAATWVISQYFVTISGANRELMEGIAALTASVMLLYVGYWLHDKMHAKQWQQYINNQLASALNRKTIWAMAFVSFLAVYREAFETVLFYQTLWMEAGDGQSEAILMGFGGAVFCLALVSWGIFKASVKLPLGLFFKITSTLLLVLAVVFAGKGVAALQEGGMISIYPINFPAIPLLGIYPNLQALSAQLIVGFIVVIGYFLVKRKNKIKT